MNQQLARRIQTAHYVNNGVGSMQLMLGTDADESRAQIDSSMYGMIRSQVVTDHDIDIAYFPGSNGTNDYIGGSTAYAQLRAEVVATAKKSIDVFNETADWIVWLAPRPVGKHLYDRDGGEDDDARAAQVAGFDVIDSLSTFIADTLRSELASLGLRTSKFIAFDMRPYSAETDTAAVNYWDNYNCADTTDYNAIRHVQVSPWNWYKPSDYAHLNDYGDRCMADSMAQYLFGITLDNSFTQGAGRTIYCDLDNGDNWANRSKCTNRNTPLATLQAGLNHASPGDIVRIIGEGNQSVMIWDSTTSARVSANTYECRVTQPGLTVYLEDGAVFNGLRQSSILSYRTTTFTGGTSFFDDVSCTAGDSTDMHSHSHADSSYKYRRMIDLDFKLEGESKEWILGYYVTFDSKGYSGLTYKNLSITGGPLKQLMINHNMQNTGQEFYMEDCIVYYDSSATGTNESYLRFTSFDSLGAADDMTDSTSWTGHIKDTIFQGRAAKNSEAAIHGRINGIDLISCQFLDDDPGGRWISPGSVNALGTVSRQGYDTFKIINCLFDAGTTYTGTGSPVYDVYAPGDTLLIVNSEARYKGASSTEFFDSSSNEHTDHQVIIINSVMKKIELSSGDITGPDDTVTNGASIGCYIAQGIESDSDTLYWGGATSFIGYDLADFGITHGTNHASIGPTQYTASPLIRLGTTEMPNVPDYAEKTIFDLQQLISTGVLSACDTTDVNTWIRVQVSNTPGGQAQAAYIIALWNDMPTATREDLLLNFSY